MYGKIIKTVKNPLFYLISFTFINFILLFNSTNLAPPDFYKYYFAAERLMAGNLKIKFIPPLFPFLLWFLGKVITPFVSTLDPFITGGKIISFFSGIGIVFFTYKLLKEFTGEIASIGTVFIIISPIFLNFLIFPITDFLYLFLVIMSFYLFLKNLPKLSLFTVLLGSITRFEGVLLFFSYIINFFNLKKKEAIRYVIAVMIISPALYFFFLKYANRLITKIIYIMKSKSFLYFFIHPNHLFYILYSGILDFLPYKMPSVLRWSVSFLMIFAFIFGLIIILKKNIRLGLAILFYEFVFAISKGYIFTVYKFHISFGHHIRRFLSFIFIFYLVSFIGVYYLLKFIEKKFEKKAFYFRSFIYIFIFYLLLVKFTIGFNILIISLLFILPILYLVIKNSGFALLEKTMFMLLFILFFSNIYLKSFVKAYRYNISTPNKGAYVIARWINKTYFKSDDKLAVFSTLSIVRYYLKRKVVFIYFVPNDKKIYGDNDKLLSYFLKKIKKYNINYIAFDGYMNPIDRPGEVALKNMLFKESKREKYFKVKKILPYKNHYAATILKPLNLDKIPE